MNDTGSIEITPAIEMNARVLESLRAMRGGAMAAVWEAALYRMRAVAQFARAHQEYFGTAEPLFCRQEFGHQPLGWMVALRPSRSDDPSAFHVLFWFPDVGLRVLRHTKGENMAPIRFSVDPNKAILDVRVSEGVPRTVIDEWKRSLPEPDEGAMP